jgi:hypothetical protein
MDKVTELEGAVPEYVQGLCIAGEYVSPFEEARLICAQTRRGSGSGVACSSKRS